MIPMPRRRSELPRKPRLRSFDEGRPIKWESITAGFRMYLQYTQDEMAQVMEGLQRTGGATNMFLFVQAAFNQAFAGKVEAMRMILSYTEGNPVDTVRVEGAKEGLNIFHHPMSKDMIEKLDSVEMFSVAATRDKDSK
jgi:hypothetical protein